MCSDFLEEYTSRAAALKTDCSRCNSCPEIPGSTQTAALLTSVVTVMIATGRISADALVYRTDQMASCAPSHNTWFLGQTASLSI